MPTNRDRDYATYYSPDIQGDEGNYNQSVRFDKTGGYVGISQYETDILKDRVLLTPKQVEALIKFVKGEK